ncbi:MAG: metal ABC transporter substrate-binding protein [Thermodesulfobacteriota bacterium]|nr:metal ABC transporter substrate-binding protein [Thermodesulfobacteriota bacterium]
MRIRQDQPQRRTGNLPNRSDQPPAGPATIALTAWNGGSKKHAHESLAFTNWLDLDLAAGQAEVITIGLSRKWPELKVQFEKNLSGLKDDLLTLDRELRVLTSKNSGIAFIGSHPVYGYLANRYQLNHTAVHWEPEQTPNPQQLKTLQEILAGHPAKWMIWEGEPTSESVQKLQAIGMQSLVFAPSANRPRWVILFR